jgi:hypothetical protein
MQEYGKCPKPKKQMYEEYKTLCSTTLWFYGNIQFHLCQESKFKEIKE